MTAALPIAAVAALALAAHLRRGSRSGGSAARRPAARPRPRPLTDEERLDVLGLAAEDGMVSFSGGCGAVALAMAMSAASPPSMPLSHTENFREDAMLDSRVSRSRLIDADSKIKIEARRYQPRSSRPRS